MARGYLKVYYDLMPAIDALKDAEAGRLLKCCIQYSTTGETPDLPGNERFTWPVFKSQIDEDLKKKRHQCEVNKRIATSRNESSRNVTKRNESSRSVTTRDDKKESSKERNINNINNKTSNKFIPPSLEEVKAYAKERNSPVDPDQFYNFFSVGNWVDSKGNPVRAWKQKFLTWEKMQEERKIPAPAPARPKQYTTAAEYKNPSEHINLDMIRKLDEQMAAWTKGD